MNEKRFDPIINNSWVLPLPKCSHLFRTSWTFFWFWPNGDVWIFFSQLSEWRTDLSLFYQSIVYCSFVLLFLVQATFCVIILSSPQTFQGGIIGVKCCETKNLLLPPALNVHFTNLNTCLPNFWKELKKLGFPLWYHFIHLSLNDTYHSCSEVGMPIQSQNQYSLFHNSSCSPCGCEHLLFLGWYCPINVFHIGFFLIKQSVHIRFLLHLSRSICVCGLLVYY